MDEYILSRSASQQLYITGLFKQILHASPVPSEKFKAILPTILVMFSQKW